MKCKRCGAENKVDANFCEKCAGKLKETCNCWVKKEPYNCGQDQCPGYRLFQMEKQLQAKLLADQLAAEVNDEGTECIGGKPPCNGKRLFCADCGEVCSRGFDNDIGEDGNQAALLFNG